jgi:beta-N-acetylhexosaminidase
MTRSLTIATLVIFAAAAVWLGVDINHASPDRARPTPANAAAPSPVQKLSRLQLAGQRVVYAYSGLRPPASLLAVIRAGEAAGVIMFAPNIGTRAQVRGAIAQLQQAALSSPLHTRLLILTDQEGGEVRRVPGQPVLSEKQIGASPSGLGLARSAGSGAGANLAGLGINANLAPVLDVYRQPGNFIDQYKRSYSSNPARVASLGAAFIAAQQRMGVAATGKHFPGLGAATVSQNTDLRPVTMRLSQQTLRAVDEAPYRGAIAAGVKLVMLSWTTYPALDAHRPAGLSATIIQSELRRRLGFRGVTITDGIAAGALAQYGGVGQRGVLAAQAGADLILCSANNPDKNSPSEGTAVLRALATGLADGRLGVAGARQAATRVLALRAHP